jgi:UDP-N-acetylmuramoyl-tripeptide--D-alanyl-D-alanine ligase
MIIKNFLFTYSPGFGRTIVYMLQSSEYQVSKYFKWLWSLEDFKKVTYRNKLTVTPPARMLLWAYFAGFITLELIGLLTVCYGLDKPLQILIGFLLMFGAPILIIEYGEGKPGDVMRFAERTHPTVGVITGVAPAHLDKYRTLKAAAKDIFSLADYLDGKAVYVNGDSAEAVKYAKKNHLLYTNQGIGSWKVSNVKVGLEGTSFTLGDKDTQLKLKTKLVGRHLIGPIVLAAYLGYVYDLTPQQITAGVAKIEPFEHRMRPYQLSGAWVIDDTYNGNIEGMKAGLALLKELKAKRKIYVTPGLVDQGTEEEKVHIQLGKLIKDANPDKVVLIKHSVTDYILKGLAGYEGDLKIEDDPLNFYMNLDKIVAAGDLVLMQNDWPDNYN